MSEDKKSKLPILASPNVKVKDYIPIVREMVLSGEVDAAEFGVILKKYEKLAKDIFEGAKGTQLKEHIYAESLKFKEGSKSTMHISGARVMDTSVHTYYVFDECGDPVWTELDKIEKQIKALKKEREDELKSKIPSDTQLTLGISNTSISVDYIPVLTLEENEDVVNIKPPVKMQRQGLKYFV